MRRAPGRAPSRRGEASWLLVVLLSLATCALLFVSRERGRTDSTAVPEVATEHEPPAEEPAPRPRIEPPPIAERRPARLDREEVRTRTELAPRAEPSSEPAPAPPAPETGALEILVRCQGIGTRATIELGHTAAGSDRETVTLHASDEQGRLLLDLPPGSVRAVGWSAHASALPAFAELAPGARTELLIELEPAHPVTGRVIDAQSGAPLAGAAVSFWTFSELDRAITAADGTFEHPRFPARAPAQQMRVEAEGYGPTVRYLGVEEDGRWQLFPRIEGEPALTGSGTPWLEIALAPELHVEGRVLDPDGRAVAGATVEAEGFYHVRPAVASCDQASTTTDEHGGFRLAGLRSDVGHSLLVRASGFALLELELAGGPVLDVGRLSLARETVLAGFVVDAAELPVEDIEVLLRPTGLPGGAPSGALDTGVRLQGRELIARTSADGAFVFENLAPNGYELVVRRDADAWIERTVLPRDGGFDELVLRLPLDALALEGTVQDERGPAASVAVELQRFGLVARTTTGPDGRFRIAGLDAKAAYAIEATRAADGVVWRSSTSSWASERVLLELESTGPGLAQLLAR